VGERWRCILTLNITLNIGVNMPKYHTRYVKEHYIKRDIKRELYEAFIEWCGENSINICLEKALSILRGNIPLNVRGNIAPNVASPTTTTVKEQSRERRRVIVFTLEWAREKNINIEEYMARKEKEGYLCNEANRKVYCIWREDIEQLVVDLNSSNAKMGELEKILNGEKLDTARKAIEAGLLWYDSREKRWRAPL
jgi:hypothetical protein